MAERQFQNNFDEDDEPEDGQDAGEPNIEALLRARNRNRAQQNSTTPGGGDVQLSSLGSVADSSLGAQQGTVPGLQQGRGGGQYTAHPGTQYMYQQGGGQVYRTGGQGQTDQGAQLNAGGQYNQAGGLYYQDQIQQSQGGAQYPQGEAQYPQGGTQYSQGGNQYSQSGVQNSNSGAQYAQGGNQYSQGGNQYSQGGTQYSQGGNQYSQGGTQFSEGGAQYSQGGVQNSNSGAQYAQGGNQFSQGGAQFSQGGAQYSQDGGSYAQGGTQFSQGGAQYSQVGAQYSQNGPQFSQGGAQFSQGGAQYTQQSSQSTQHGAQFTQPGAQNTQGAAQYSQGGTQYSQGGTQYTQSGVQYPQLGAQYSQSGVQLSRGEGQFPPSGPQSSQNVTQYYRDGGQHTQAGSQQLQTGAQYLQGDQQTGRQPVQSGGQYVQQSGQLPSGSGNFNHNGNQYPPNSAQLSGNQYIPSVSQLNQQGQPGTASQPPQAAPGFSPAPPAAQQQQGDILSQGEGHRSQGQGQGGPAQGGSGPYLQDNVLYSQGSTVGAPPQGQTAQHKVSRGPFPDWLKGAGTHGQAATGSDAQRPPKAKTQEDLALDAILGEMGQDSAQGVSGAPSVNSDINSLDEGQRVFQNDFQSNAGNPAMAGQVNQNPPLNVNAQDGNVQQGVGNANLAQDGNIYDGVIQHGNQENGPAEPAAPRRVEHIWRPGEPIRNDEELIDALRQIMGDEDEPNDNDRVNEDDNPNMNNIINHNNNMNNNNRNNGAGMENERLAQLGREGNMGDMMQQLLGVMGNQAGDGEGADIQQLMGQQEGLLNVQGVLEGQARNGLMGLPGFGQGQGVQRNALQDRALQNIFGGQGQGQQGVAELALQNLLGGQGQGEQGAEEIALQNLLAGQGQGQQELALQNLLGGQGQGQQELALQNLLGGQGQGRQGAAAPLAMNMFRRQGQGQPGGADRPGQNMIERPGQGAQVARVPALQEHGDGNVPLGLQGLEGQDMNDHNVLQALLRGQGQAGEAAGVGPGLQSVLGAQGGEGNALEMQGLLDALPGGGRGRRGNQQDEEEFDPNKADLNTITQQLLTMEGMKAQRNQSPRAADGMCTIVIIDTSGSIQGEPLIEAGRFLAEFINGLEEIQFEYGLEENLAIVSVGQDTHVVQHLTKDFSLIRRAADSLDASGHSPLYLGLLLPQVILGGNGFNRREGIATVSNHSVVPRVILISDGHPSSSPDVPGVLPNPRDQQNLQIRNICAVFAQQMSEQTMAKLYCVPVGNADLEFLGSLAGLTGGKLVQSVDAKTMSRCYLHHFVMGKATSSGRHFNDRQSVVPVVRQEMTSSDDADVTAVWELIREGEPDFTQHDRRIEERMREQQQQQQQAQQGEGQGQDLALQELLGGGAGGQAGQEAALQELLGAGGGGRGQEAVLQELMGGGAGGRGQALFGGRDGGAGDRQLDMQRMMMNALQGGDGQGQRAVPGGRGQNRDIPAWAEQNLPNLGLLNNPGGRAVGREAGGGGGLMAGGGAYQAGQLRPGAGQGLREIQGGAGNPGNPMMQQVAGRGQQGGGAFQARDPGGRGQGGGVS